MRPRRPREMGPAPGPSRRRRRLDAHSGAGSPEAMAPGDADPQHALASFSCGVDTILVGVAPGPSGARPARPTPGSKKDARRLLLDRAGANIGDVGQAGRPGAVLRPAPLGGERLPSIDQSTPTS